MITSKSNNAGFHLCCASWFQCIQILALTFACVQSFNLENRLPIYKFDLQNDSYFGYSVAIHHEVLADKKWILVGAPLGKNPQPNTTRSGTLKKCPITQEQQDCEDVITDGRLNSIGYYEKSDDDELFPPQPSEIKEGQWLGVTVSTQRQPGGIILVCAHRYILKPGYDTQHGQGLCYVLTNDFDYDSVVEPCKGRSTAKLHEEYAFCQAGTSGTLMDDGTMIVGAPGVYTWRGSLYTTELAGNYLARDKYHYYTPHYDTDSPVDKYSYLGMAVTGGQFFGNETTYVGGAPRSENHGQVVFFKKVAKSNPMKVILKLDGEQFASGFGYQLATADVNGDNLPDLLVSAPFYFGRQEGGAVYVYINNEHNFTTNFDLKLTGKLESRFGLALANMGDINNDMADDIAIGAPYEDDGVVYIYLGSKDGLSKVPSQIIRSSDLGLEPNRKINTFGSYLTGGLDIDNNGYPDLVAGAYNSSAAIALLARPIINIITQVPKKGEIKAIDPSLKGCSSDWNTNSTCFTFTTCCSVEKAEKSESMIIIYTIEAETFNSQKKFSRVYFGPDTMSRSNIMRRNFSMSTDGVNHCFNETVYVKDNARDIQSPIRFHLNYTMVEDPLQSSGLLKLNPILDQTQAERTFEVAFQKDCGSDDICESQLEVEASMALQEEKDGHYTFVLGQSDDVHLNVTVKNHADSAYEAQLFVIHQQSVSYIGASKGSVICNQFNETVVMCTLGNPLKRGSTARTILRFDPSGIEDSEPRMSFRVYANSTSKQKKPSKDIILTSNIVKRAELSITGYARPSQVFYGGEIKGESAMKHFDDIGTSVVHTFQIYNDGPWRAPFVEVDIEWPHQVGNDKPLGKWLLYLEDIPVVDGAGGGECNVDERLVNPLKLTQRQELANLIQPAATEFTSFTKRGNKSHTFAMEYREKSSSTSDEKKTFTDGQILNRVRRDHAMKIKAEQLFDKDGKRTDIVPMDCARKTAKCIKIKCKIYNMQRKTEAFIHVKSRLWNSTLTMDYPRVDWVTIFSSAKLSIPTMYSIQQNTTNDFTTIETHAYPELRDQTTTDVIPYWIIIVGIFVGLFLLALVAFILWKCGFFKRRRPDPTLSGNLEKHSEARPFISK